VPSVGPILRAEFKTLKEPDIRENEPAPARGDL